MLEIFQVSAMRDYRETLETYRGRAGYRLLAQFVEISLRRLALLREVRSAQHHLNDLYSLEQQPSTKPGCLHFRSVSIISPSIPLDLCSPLYWKLHGILQFA